MRKYSSSKLSPIPASQSCGIGFCYSLLLRLREERGRSLEQYSLSLQYWAIEIPARPACGAELSCKKKKGSANLILGFFAINTGMLWLQRAIAKCRKHVY